MQHIPTVASDHVPTVPTFRRSDVPMSPPAHLPTCSPLPTPAHLPTCPPSDVPTQSPASAVQPVSVQNHSVGVMFLHLVESTKQYKSNACRNIKYSDHTVYSADCKQLKLVVTSLGLTGDDSIRGSV